MINIILIILIFAIPLAIDNTCYETGYIKNVILYIGSIWLLYFLWIKKPKLPDISILLFFGWIILSYLLNPFKTGNPLQSVIILFCYLIVYIAARDYLSENTLTNCIMWTMTILLIVVIYDFWDIRQKLYQNFTHFAYFKYRGNFGQAGVNGSWLVMAMPFLLYHKRRVACFAGFFLLWLTGSRAAILGAIFAFLALASAQTNQIQQKITKIWAKTIVSVISISILISLIWVIYPRLIPQQAERHSYWQSATSMIIDKPITGYGIGSFRIQYPRYRSPFITEKVFQQPMIDLHHAHSWPLEMGAELGIVGVGLFLFLIWRHWKMSQEWGIIAGIMACLIANITDVAFGYVPIGFLFWLYLGLLGKDIERNTKLENMGDYFYNR